VVNGEVAKAEAVGFGLAQQILSSGESFADLLEAEFPDGLPSDPDDPTAEDEDAVILGDLPHDYDSSADDDPDLENLDDLEHLKGLEDMAGSEKKPLADHEEDEEDSYD